MVMDRRRVIDHHRRADQLRFARGGRRIGFAVGRDHAEIIFAVGQHVGIEGDGVVVRAGAQQLPLGFVFAAEIEVVDQAVAIGILGLPAQR